MLRSSVRLFIAAIVALGLAAALAAQAPANPQQPTFRTGVNFVRVDVYPTLNGQPVSDLQKSDFEVLEDGVLQALESFEHIAIRLPGVGGERGEPNTVRASNDAAGDPRSRVFVLFIDRYHIQTLRGTVTRPGATGTELGAPESARRAASALSGFLQRLVGPDDLVALMTPDMPTSALTFTRDPIAIQDMIRSGAWEHVDNDWTDADERDRFYMACYGPSSSIATEMMKRRHERMVLTALRSLVAHLQSLREERKGILLVTEGWTLFRPHAIAGNMAPNLPGIGIQNGKPVLGDPRSGVPLAECERDRQTLSEIDDEREFRELLQVANRANATFYPVDPSGLQAPVSAAGWNLIDRKQDPLRSLAAETDGIALVNTNDLTPGLKRISEDLSSYYLLGYNSTNSKHDGAFRKIKVRVKRPGVAVRARSGYMAPTEADVRAEAAANDPPPSPERAAVDSALDVLDRSRPDRIILLRGGYSWPVATKPDNEALAWVTVELAAAAARQPGWAEGGKLRASVLDLDGKLLASASGTLSATSRSCLIRFADGSLSPGDYLLRVRADWSVLTTTEQVRIKVPDRSDTTARSLGEPVMLRRGPYSGAGFQPTADARFRRAERVRLDIPLARPSDAVVAQLLDRKGQPLPVPVATSTREEATGAFVSAELALTPLAQADYVIEVSVSRAGKTEKSLTAIRIVP